MIRKALLLFAVYFLFSAAPGYCLDWKALHETADRTSLESARAAVQKSPSDIEKLYLLGLVDLNVHEDKDADVAFSRIIALDPKAEEALWGRAEVLRRGHQLDESEKMLVGIIRDRPKFPSAYISLADIRYIRMDFNGTVSLARKVLDLGGQADLSNRVRAYLLYVGAKGMIAHYGGPISKVINGSLVLPTLHTAQSLQPGSAGVLLGLGSFYLLAPPLVGGDLNAAEKYLTQAAQADPLFADTYVRLAQLYKIEKNNGKYELYLKKAFEIDPKNELALDTQSGRCRFICGR